jgi:hypothetical protein
MFLGISIVAFLFLSAAIITGLFILMGSVSLMIYYVLFKTEQKQQRIEKSTA